MIANITYNLREISNWMLVFIDVMVFFAAPKAWMAQKKSNQILQTQLDNSKAYDEAVAAFELVKEAGNIMQDYYRKYFDIRGFQKETEDEKDALSKAYCMAVLACNFIGYIDTYQEVIEYPGLRRVFENYVKINLSSEPLQAFLLPQEVPKYEWKHRVSGIDKLGEKLSVEKWYIAKLQKIKDINRRYLKYEEGIPPGWRCNNNSLQICPK